MNDIMANNAVMLLSAFIFLVIIGLNIWIYKLDVPESENLRKILTFFENEIHSFVNNKN
jgi:hypothetical protein